MNPEIFKAYDIRGIYPTEIDEDAAYKIGKAYAAWLKPKKVALGRDVRIHGEGLWKECARGLNDMGVDVVDIGVISTDMLYFAVANYGFDGGITISASHNAGEYNGMKIVKEEAKPVSMDSGLAEIRDLAFKNDFAEPEAKGGIEKLDILNDYVGKMTSFAKKDVIKNLKVVVNPNFGASGKAIQRIADYYGLELIKINFDPDGTFPKGKPDPLMEENRKETVQLIKENKPSFGATWDADADRCFFYDEKGDFIHPYYVTALIIEYFFKKQKGAKILIDPRLRWLPKEIVFNNGGELVINKSGHSFIKERMRKEDVLFGAETSAHYYFKDLWYTDNGMIPFIIVLEVLSNSNKSLSELISFYKEKFPVIEEKNFTVDSVKDILDKLRSKYSDGKFDDIDGVSVEYQEWRFNVRGSNTEPVLRLNLEAKSKEILKENFRELEKEITG